MKITAFDLINQPVGLYHVKRPKFILQDLMHFISFGNPQEFIAPSGPMAAAAPTAVRNRVEGGGDVIDNRMNPGVTSGGGSIPAQTQFVNNGLSMGSGVDVASIPQQLKLATDNTGTSTGSGKTGALVDNTAQNGAASGNCANCKVCNA
jgi:hypothetical protein